MFTFPDVLRDLEQELSWWLVVPSSAFFTVTLSQSDVGADVVKMGDHRGVRVACAIGHLEVVSVVQVDLKERDELCSSTLKHFVCWYRIYESRSFGCVLCLTHLATIDYERRRPRNHDALH